MTEQICSKCRIKLGFKPRDQGSHTAVIRKCDSCGQERSILPARHWVKPVHGSTCEKVKHTGGDYSHGHNDNGPYDVDGVKYCGRCHNPLIITG